MPKWIDDLNREVIERDGGDCILCGDLAWDVHHIIPRSRGKKYSRKFWRIENMCCICRRHHDNTRETRVKCVDKMAELGYDMAWVKEHMIWEGKDGL